jgi:DNA repair protein RAD51
MIKKLVAGGLHTVESVAYSTIKSLTAIKGIAEPTAQKLLTEASKLVPMGFTTASEFHKTRAEIIHLSSRCPSYRISGCLFSFGRLC